VSLARELPVSPPLNHWIILSIFQFRRNIPFLNQVADIKLISSLVNKKAPIDQLNALKKFGIAMSTLS
jgi:hypothetical protein